MAEVDPLVTAVNDLAGECERHGGWIARDAEIILRRLNQGLAADAAPPLSTEEGRNRGPETPT